MDLRQLRRAPLRKLVLSTGVCLLAGAAVGQTVSRPDWPARQQGSAAVQPAVSLRTAQVEQFPVALGGHCPVTLLLDKQWVAGDVALRAVFDHREYWFASARQRAIFAAAPQTYAPVLGGDCIVAFADGGQRVAGGPQFGAVHGGRLFFFASAIERQRFLDHPENYADADLANGGLCPVAAADEGRQVAGIPAASALFDGQRYQFASSFNRIKFAQQPLRYVQESELSEFITDAPQRSMAPRSNVPGVVAPNSKRSVGGPSGEFGSPNDPNDGSGIVLASAPIMSGYCPVSIREQSQWVLGRREYRAAYGGTTVQLAGRRELEAFRAAPHKYLPALAGDCVVTYVESTQRVRGSVYFAGFHPVAEDGSLTEESRLYLFADEEKKAVFQTSPDDFADVDLAEGGICIVTRHEDGKIVPGDPTIDAWHNGMRYQFASEAERDRFLTEPLRYLGR